MAYFARMTFVTIGYHRYFSHRSFKTSRWFQFVLAFLAESSAQKGALWWAAHHRDHHKYSDQPEDLHSPVQNSLWWSHVGWIISRKYNETKFERIKDFAKYPELRFISKHYWIPPVAMAAVLIAIGGLPLAIWGYLVSTVLLWHGTFTLRLYFLSFVLRALLISIPSSTVTLAVLPSFSSTTVITVSPRVGG